MIVAIQSFTDVITNSSSTVFIMHSADARYYKSEDGENVRIQKIDIQWLLDNSDEVEAICAILGFDPSIVAEEHGDCWKYWEVPNQETWESFLETHKERITQKFKNLYWVDMDDYSKYENEARNNCEWHKSRH